MKKDATPRRHGKGARKSKSSIKHQLNNYVLHHRKTFTASLKRFWSTPWQSLVTTLVIAIALALPAGLLVAVENIEQLGGRVESSANISLFLKRGLKEPDSNNFIKTLQQREDITSVEYVSQQQALAEFSTSSGFGEVLGLLDHNPLPATLLITPHDRLISDEQALSELVAWLEKQVQVDDLSLDLGWLQRLQAIAELGRQLVWGLGIALAFGVVLVMGNTIRLAIEGRRDEIVVVKLIGGTDGYVRRPFLYTGLWFGFFGGLIAWCVVWLGFYSLSGEIKHLAALYQSQFVVLGPGILKLLQLLLLGGLLGLTGAWVAVYGHLRKVEVS